MRLAVVTDIHGNLPALEAVVRDFTRRGVDHVINLGDSLSGPLLPRETARDLMARDWTHLAGNHERQVLHAGPHGRGASDQFAFDRLGDDALAWIGAQRPTLQFDEAVFCCHGSPRSDLEYLMETVDPDGMRPATRREIEERTAGVRGDVILCGHTHVPRVTRSTDGTLIVNPGSVGLPGWTDERPFPHFVSAGSPDARYAIVERGVEGWMATLIAVPYDHEAMAALARERGFDEWATALATGWVFPAR